MNIEGNFKKEKCLICRRQVGENEQEVVQDNSELINFLMNYALAVGFDGDVLYEAC